MKYKLIIAKSINIECKDAFYITTSAHETIGNKKKIVVPDIIVSDTELYLINEILGDFKIPYILNYKAMRNYGEVLQFAKDIKLFTNDNLDVMIISLGNEIKAKSYIYSELFINKIKNIIALIKLAISIAKPILIFVSVDDKGNYTTDTIITRDDEKKRIVENFIIFASDPVETIQHVSGQLQEVFQQLLDEINSDETKKTMFTHTMGYMSEIAELYFSLY